MNFYTYPQQYYQPQQTVMRVVTSRAEAEVAQIPLDGSNAFFFNTSNGEVYLKAFRADGTAPLAVYKRESEAAPAEFVTQAQFDVLSKAIVELKARVDAHE